MFDTIFDKKNVNSQTIEFLVSAHSLYFGHSRNGDFATFRLFSRHRKRPLARPLDKEIRDGCVRKMFFFVTLQLPLLISSKACACKG
jgi:hypothetical protein